MTYFPTVPQETDIRSESQPNFLSNFRALASASNVDHIPFGNSIEAATRANPAVIRSTTHGLATGNTVTISKLSGILNDIVIPWTVNGSTSAVTVIDANNFSLDTVDSTLENPYIANTGTFNSANIDYMYHRKISFAEPLGPFPSIDPPPAFPNLASPIASLFTMDFTFLRGDKEQVTRQLFYQNGVEASDVLQLTNRSVKVVVNPVTKELVTFSMKTPWGLTINSGVASTLGNIVTTFILPVGFRYATGGHYTTVLTIGNDVQFPLDLDSFKVSNLTDNSFDLQYTGTTVNNGINNANFISIGKTA